MQQLYCDNLTGYQRRQTIEVRIGDVPLGAHHPIRVQSMTTTDTLDTAASVAQAIRMIEAGCEYVRFTAPSIKEAENLANIKQQLRRQGYTTPLVADIHFTPNAAEVAARIVEKVRINPGNYIDRKKFQLQEYTEAQYAEEVERIRERLVPLLNICKEYGTALRIGTNHGSLSDRIMSRYGDTPLGMVESALEFLRICEDEGFDQVVLSMKASNALVMIEAYRLLVSKLREEGLKPYPLHLGVTEAGESEDGRIKSALGIGTLLEDGLGDTIRVSLTEEPEHEIPVARTLVERYRQRPADSGIPRISQYKINPYAYQRRTTRPVANLGGDQVPVVVTDLSNITTIDRQMLAAIGHHYLPVQDKWVATDLAADLLYPGPRQPSTDLPGYLKILLDYEVWQEQAPAGRCWPLFTPANYRSLEEPAWLQLEVDHDSLPANLADNTILLLHTTNPNRLAALRRFINELMLQGITNPVVIRLDYRGLPPETFQLYAATDAGGLLADGLGDGLMLTYDDIRLANQTAFGILQAARARITKTEYISCPSCGRTLFDLQETTARIRERTSHLKGVKIGIMGCIVNGPGEMADADYGYVGSGPGKITLYKGQEIVKKGIPAAQAVDELIELIKAHGDWTEPETLTQES